ncbi:transposase domain-containing protein (plasmid) [Mesorhizobium sp. AR02]|nr:transposase domain-containing protein [Mesorhizobium sp. AR02]UVK49958.1 transposase domain-containing protein [Mesorhizobium sp. AR02]
MPGASKWHGGELDVTERIQNDWPASRWDELMPWSWVRREEMPLPLAA